jgi:hypothetical protein
MRAANAADRKRSFVDADAIVDSRTMASGDRFDSAARQRRAEFLRALARQVAARMRLRLARILVRVAT